MKILIATGIYPPDVGGPAQYAFETEQAFRRKGHEVNVLYFRLERKLPTGVRHLYYFLRVVLSLRGVDFVFSPDTWSAALPATIAAKLFGKKIIIRTGGDFLWEWYVERTGDLVLLRDFYATRMDRLNAKERLIFTLTGYVFKKADAVIFSTKWQRDLFEKPYLLDRPKCFIVENFYGERFSSARPQTNTKRVFVAGTRKLAWKNAARVEQAFEMARAKGAPVSLDTDIVPHEKFLEKISASYAVIIATLGDISPNTILDSIRCGKPFILTRETGLYDRLKDVALFVDPENAEDIAEKIMWLSDEKNYTAQQEKVRAFSFRHSWGDIAEEILAIYART